MTLAQKTKALILGFGHHEIPQRKEVASLLNISSRTLQRRLADEKTSFSRIVYEIRMDLAKTYIKQGHLTNEEIANRLGYEDVRSFYRSYKSRYNCSPKRNERDPEQARAEALV